MKKLKKVKEQKIRDELLEEMKELIDIDRSSNVIKNKIDKHDLWQEKINEEKLKKIKKQKNIEVKKELKDIDRSSKVIENKIKKHDLRQEKKDSKNLKN